MIFTKEKKHFKEPLKEFPWTWLQNISMLLKKSKYELMWRLYIIYLMSVKRIFWGFHNQLCISFIQTSHIILWLLKLVVVGQQLYQKNTLSRANSRPLLGMYIECNQVPWVLKKIFSLELVKNDTCLGGARSKMSFSKKLCHASSV